MAESTPKQGLCTYPQLQQVLANVARTDGFEICVLSDVDVLPIDGKTRFAVQVNVRMHLEYREERLTTAYAKGGSKKEAETKAASQIYDSLPAILQGLRERVALKSPMTLSSSEFKPSPLPLSEVTKSMEVIAEAKKVQTAAQKAHLDIMLAHPACKTLSVLMTVSLPYDALATVLVTVIGTAGDEAAAKAHNALMHALNGNGLRANLHSAIDKAMDDAQGLSAEARLNMVVRAVKAQFNAKRKPRKSDGKKANKKQHAKNGNTCSDITGQPFDDYYCCYYCKGFEHEEGCPAVDVGDHPRLRLGRLVDAEFRAFVRQGVKMLHDSFHSMIFHPETSMHKKSFAQVAFAHEAFHKSQVKPVDLSAKVKVLEAEALAHNAEMHADNGNESFVEAMADYLSQAGAIVDPLYMPSESAHHRDLFLQSLDDGWDQLPMQAATNGVRAVDADAHNSEMHASNGNEMVAMMPQQLPGRMTEEYTAAIERFKADKRVDGLTKEANDLMLQLTDPCADVPRDTCDWTSGLMDPILTTKYVSEISITKPAGTGTWSFGVCTDQFAGFGPATNGWHSTLTSSVGALQNLAGSNRYSTQTLTDKVFGGEPVVFCRGLDGTNLFDTWDPNNVGTVGIPNVYTQGPWRLAGIGIEVINTTAPLYKSGMVTAFEYPARKVDTVSTYVCTAPTGTIVLGASDMANLGASTANLGFSQAVRTIGTSRPPKTQSEAANSRGSKSWNAAEGYYAPAVFEDIPEVGNNVNFLPHWYSESPNEGAGGNGDVTQFVGLVPWKSHDSITGTLKSKVIATTFTNSNSTLGTSAANPFIWTGNIPAGKYVPTSRKGCFFTGLSEQTTLTLRVVYYITRVPQVSQIDLYTMSRKAPGFDPYFWAAYKHMCSSMPVGAMFTENPLGEWFNTVTKFLAKNAPVIGGMIPGMGSVGNIVGAVAGAANRFNRGKPLQKKNKN